MYKKIIFFTILLGFAIKSNAQYSGMSFEVHYPLIFSNSLNDYSDTNGVLGGSLQYQFTDNIPFNFGLEYKFDLIQAVRKLEYSDPTQINYLISNINLFSKMMLITMPEMQIYVSGGFTQYKYKSNPTGRSNLGFNIGGGLNYDIYNQIYLFSNYSYLNTTLKYNNGESGNNETHQMVRIGFGFKF